MTLKRYREPSSRLITLNLVSWQESGVWFTWRRQHDKSPLLHFTQTIICIIKFKWINLFRAADFMVIGLLVFVVIGQPPHLGPLFLSCFLELQQVSEDFPSAGVGGRLPGQRHWLLGEVNGLEVYGWTGFHCDRGQGGIIIVSENTKSNKMKCFCKRWTYQWDLWQRQVWMVGLGLRLPPHSQHWLWTRTHNLAAVLSPSTPPLDRFSLCCSEPTWDHKY